MHYIMSTLNRGRERDRAAVMFKPRLMAGFSQ
jgi:hypothetical protein